MSFTEALPSTDEEALAFLCKGLPPEAAAFVTDAYNSSRSLGKTISQAGIDAVKAMGALLGLAMTERDVEFLYSLHLCPVKRMGDVMADAYLQLRMTGMSDEVAAGMVSRSGYNAALKA